MDIPKPHPFKSTVVVVEPVKSDFPIIEKVKHPYVLQPHMIDRPLRNNEALMNLKKSMDTRPQRTK